MCMTYYTIAYACTAQAGIHRVATSAIYYGAICPRATNDVCTGRVVEVGLKQLKYTYYSCRYPNGPPKRWLMVKAVYFS